MNYEKKSCVLKSLFYILLTAVYPFSKQILDLYLYQNNLSVLSYFNNLFIPS